MHKRNTKKNLFLPIFSVVLSLILIVSAILCIVPKTRTAIADFVADKFSPAYEQQVKDNEAKEILIDDLISQLEDKNVELETLQENLKTASAEIVDLENSIVLLDTEIAELTELKQGLEQQKIELQSNIETLQNDIVTLEETKSQLELDKTNNEAEIERLNGELTTKSSALTTLQSDYDTLLLELVQADTDLATANAEKETLQNEISTLNATITTLNARVSELEAQVADLEEQLQNAGGSTENTVNPICGVWFGRDNYSDPKFEMFSFIFKVNDDGTCSLFSSIYGNTVNGNWEYIDNEFTSTIVDYTIVFKNSQKIFMITDNGSGFGTACYKNMTYNKGALIELYVASSSLVEINSSVDDNLDDNVYKFLCSFQGTSNGDVYSIDGYLKLFVNNCPVNCKQFRGFYNNVSGLGFSFNFEADSIHFNCNNLNSQNLNIMLEFNIDTGIYTITNIENF